MKTASNIITFSFDRNLPLVSALQMFIDMWAKDTDYKERNEAISLIAELLNVSKNPKEYVVTFPVSKQISEDSWKVINPTFKIDSNSRISIIEDFFRTHNAHETLEIKLIELQK